MANRLDWLDFWTEVEREDVVDDEAAQEFPRLKYKFQAVPLMTAVRAHIDRAQHNEETFTKLAEMYRGMMSRSLAQQAIINDYKEMLMQQLSSYEDE